jgi:thiol-disulfide isomerase/thioredoxin
MNSRRNGPDTLKKYKLKMSLTTFKYVDAYVYLVSLTNISSKLHITGEYGEHLLRAYMIPAILKDLSTYKQYPTKTSLELIWQGSLENTIAIGSVNGMSRDAVSETYNLYTSFEKVCKPLRTSRDTTIRNYVNSLFKDVENYKQVLQTQMAYYDKDYERSLNTLLKGLNSNSFPSGRVLSIAEQLLNTLTDRGEKGKSLMLLNALMLNTTKESISRQVLKDWYVKINPSNGEGIFNRILASLPSSSFKHSGKRVELLKQWNFIFNAVNSEKLKTTKYYLLDVWYTSCGACLTEIPDLNSFYDSLKSRNDITFISLNTDFVNGKEDEKYVLERSAELGIKFPIVYDNVASNLAAKLGVDSFPSKYIIDSTGRIITKLDNSKNSLTSFEMFIKELK